MLRVKDGVSLLPEYLAAILRSRLALSQTVHMMTGNTHPRLTNDDMANLMIPIPLPEVQARVADEIAQRRDEVQRLRGEGEAGWEKAKRWFEGELLYCR